MSWILGSGQAGSYIPLSGCYEYGLSGYLHPLGLEYFRSDSSGNGYLILTLDINNEIAYASGIHSSYRINLDNRGNILSSSGFNPAIDTQSYAVQGDDDVLTPLKSGHLSKTYPLTRRIRDDSGVYWDIDHYEPYHGWIRNENLNVVANVDYDTDFYYDSEGKKIWYRTAYNNPYGSGNFTTVYLDLRNIPIYNTLTLYDIDILDISGNATEINRTGITLYHYQSPYMFSTETGIFDPVYVGYSPTVPSGQGFGQIEGATCNQLAIIHWDYQLEDGGLDDQVHRYIESPSGEIAAKLKIINPWSRYIAEYQFARYKQAKYITSLERNRYLSLDTLNPIYSLQTKLDNAQTLDYRFTNDSRYADTIPSRRGEFITFDGWKVRPLSLISRVDFDLPLLYDKGTVTSPFNVEYRYSSIGYTNEHVPILTSTRNYILDCPFDSGVISGVSTEGDLSGSGNYLTFCGSGNAWLYKIPYESYYGKKIKYNSGDVAYFYKDSWEFLKKDTYFWFKFRPLFPQVITLLEMSEDTSDYYIKLWINSNGMIIVESNGTQLYSRYRMEFNGEKEIILRYYPDEEYTTLPRFELFIKDGTTIGFKKLDPFIRETSTFTVSSTYFHAYKNCMIDVDRLKIYYEAQ